MPLKDTVVGDSRASLWLLFGSVSVLLLIACTNIAALLLSRAAKREQEIAVRYSLGGSRAAVVAQLLTEAAVLAIHRSGCGAASWRVAASRALRALAPELPRVNEIAIDGRILLYTVASTAVVALLCGLFPRCAARAWGQTTSRSARTQVAQRHSIQWLLVGVQVALSVTLLAGAGLLLRSVAALSRVDLGFDSSHVLTLHVSGTYGWETTDGRHVQRINRVIDAIDVDSRRRVGGHHLDLARRARRAASGVRTRSRDGRPPRHRSLPNTASCHPATSRPCESRCSSGELCRVRRTQAARQASITEVMVNRPFRRAATWPIARQSAFTSPAVSTRWSRTVI